MEDDDILDSFFPKGYEYEVISCDKIETSSLSFADANFDMELRGNADTIEKFKDFLKKFNYSSCSTYNVKHGRPDKKPTGEKAREFC